MLKTIYVQRIIGIALLLLSTSAITLAQSNGDYQTRAAGNWNSNTTWQVRSGGAWVNCSAGDYPGATAGAGTVNILNNQTVTVTADVPNNIGALSINGGNSDTYLQFSGAYSLTVSGQTYLNSNSNFDDKAVLVDAGIFRSGSVNANSGNNNRDAFIRISTGEVHVDGTINLNGNGRRTYILFTGDGDLYVEGSISGGIITSTTGGSTSSPPTSGTVIYNGSSAQDIGEYVYYNLTTDNSTGLSLPADITVNNILTMTAGNISTGGNTLILASSTSSDLVFTSGTIIGSLQRAINTPTGTEYLFPVGTASNYNPFKTTFTNLTAGDLIVSYQASDIGTSGLPLTDGSVEITDRHSTGYWTLVASNGMASGDYDINLNYNGFTGVTTSARIMKRTAGGSLTVDGTHGSVSSPEITRTGLNGISTTSTDFAIGKTGLEISTHPADYSGCAPTFTVVASGTPPLTYQWQEDDGSGFSNITDGGIYSGATTASLSISATPVMTAYLYRCVVTDGNSSSETSNSALLTYSLPDVSLGYNYTMPLTLDAASGSSDLTDFPALISISSLNLRSDANGGNVLNSNGYDIIFTDSNNNQLDHELEYYDPVSGEYVGWVRIPVLSASSTTTINIIYGNATISSDPSSEEVWTSNYKGVWHLNETDYSDATQYSNDGTNNNTSDITGIIAGGRGFNGTDSYIQVTTTGFVPNDNNQTISIWANYATAPSGSRNLISFQNTGASSAIQLGFRGGNAVAWKWGGVVLANGGASPSTNNWHYYVYTYDGTNSRLYIDGVEMDNSTVAPQTALPSEGNIGRYNNGEYISASLDEPRFSISPKSAGWVLTEYNNQNDPASFISVGTQTTNNILASIGACSSTFLLNQGYPTGGSYSGTGVSGTNFDASSAGVGSHSITYTYTDGDGCSNNTSRNIFVTAIPVAPTATDKECCVSNILDLEASGTNLSWYSDAALTTLVGTGTPFATGETAAGTYTYYATQTVNGCESAAASVQLIVHSGIAINTQPVAATICEGDNATFTIDASGFNLTYQWQEDTGSGFSDITDGGIYSDATTATLTLTDPGLVNSGNNYQCVVSSACGASTLTSNSVALIVTPPQVATFSYAGSPYCPTDSDPLPTFSGGGVAGTFSSTAGLVFISTSTGEIDLSASTPATYTVTNTLAATGGCGEVTATSDITILSGEIWTGAIDTDWNTAANWSCSYIPTGSTSVQIPDVANKPVLSSGAIASVNDLSIDAGSSLTINGNTIQIAGSITNNGTFTSSNGTVEFNGSVAQTIPAGLFENNAILNLIVNNAAGLTLAGPLSVSGIVYPQNGDLSSGGNLTITSDASGTALIEGSGSGTVSGNIIMQRYLPERFGYKYFSSPFQSATVNEYANDIDLAFWYPTIFEYDESRTSSGWVDYSNPAGVLVPLKGYALNFGSSLSADTVDITGIVNDGALSITLYNNNNTYTQGMNLVGNPYPSPIDWDAVAGWTKTNIDDAIYYFKSSTTDEYGGTYSSYVAGVSSDGLVSNIIPSMQGFFVHVADGSYPVTATLGLNNNVRISDLSHAFTKSKSLNSKGSYSLIRLSAEYEDDPGSTDPCLIYLHPFASEEYDYDSDALKLLNTDFSIPNLYSVLPDNRKLSINSLPEPMELPKRIPLGLKTNRAGNIVFSILNIDILFSDYTIKLFDSQEGISKTLQGDSTYVTRLDAGEYHSRFFLDILDTATDISNPEIQQGLFNAYRIGEFLNISILVQPEDKGLITITNLVGQIVQQHEVSSIGHFEYYTPFKHGIYILSYSSGRKYESQKIILGR